MAKGNFQKLVNQNIPVLVDFTASWCGPCQAMKPILKEVADKMSGKAKIIKIDVDKNKALASKMGIRSVPTLMLYKNGEVKWQQAGVVPARDLIKLLEQNA